MSNCGNKCDKGNIYLDNVNNRHTIKCVFPSLMRRRDQKIPSRIELICVLSNLLHNKAKFYPQISCNSQAAQKKSLVEGILCIVFLLLNTD